MRPMAELVWTRSEDGLQLEGLACVPAQPLHDGPGFVLIHGMASRFYSHSVASVAEGLARRGYAAVSGNTRGHDYGAFLSRPDGSLVLGGAAFEDPAEAPLDLAGWIGWAAEQFGARRLVLVGHSLGGFKAAHYQAERQDPRVAALALLSPAFRGSPSWWRADLEPQARQLGANELLAEPLGFVGRVSARTFLARSPERWPDDLSRLLQRAGRPSFVSYGTVADIGGPRQLAALGPGVATRLVDGADHNYSGRWDEVAGLLATWIQGLPTAPAPR